MSDPDAARPPADAGRATRRLAAVLALAAVPWTVLAYDGGVGFVFAWGLVNPAPPHVVPLPEYLFRLSGGAAGLPRRLLAWPVSALLYVGAAASAAAGRVGREDRRVTGGLLALAGVGHLAFAVGTGRPGLAAVPVGPVLLWAVAWWGYRDRLLAWPASRPRR